mmetsp:Transcript_3202/g.8337  ORF Transcript_3202/g.8337 Transcript_3202/m.8337 type:complete len:269 (-) Transcript_3202:52-858(-)
MGSLAKVLGQWSRRSLLSESAHIHKTSRANKIPDSLALRLDGTLKQAHDMRAFGLGTLASMASRERYRQFTSAMHAVYSTMEAELSKGQLSLWQKHGPVLARSEALHLDLTDVANDPKKAIGEISPATQRYVERIRECSEHDRNTGGARLVGHIYCRYFADLFGGQMLAKPYKFALDLPVDTPRHYSFKFPAELANPRRDYIETVYRDISSIGESLTEEQKTAVVQEALAAFSHNIEVYTENGPVMYDAIRGVWNVSIGWVKQIQRKT